MSAPEPPLNPETLDELLSADIDGEFERAAADLGFTVDEARAAMNATAGTARRRTQLGAAADRLATPIVLPAAVEQALVSAALRGPVDELRAVRQRRTRSWRVLVAAGSAAAVIAAVVVFAATNDHGGVAKSASAVSPAAHPRLPLVGPPLQSEQAVEFGDVSGPATLRADVELRLREAVPNPAATSSVAAGPTPANGGAHIVAELGAEGATGTRGLVGPAGPQGPQGLQGPSGLAGPQGLQGDEGIQGPIGPTGPSGAQGVTGAIGASVTGAEGGTGAAGPQFAPVSTLANAPSDQAAGGSFAANSTVGANRERVCVATIERAAHLGSAPVLSGIGTYARRPAVIVVFSRDDGYVVYVLAATDCIAVAQQTLP
ncbi:MAG: hypothetical protein ACLPVY_26450 [Acidimicrobiia bacterium]